MRNITWTLHKLAVLAFNFPKRQEVRLPGQDCFQLPGLFFDTVGCIPGN